MSSTNKKTKAEQKTNILVITLGFIGLWFLTNKQYIVLLYISLGVGVLSLISNGIMNWILWIWDRIALVLGWINTRILLATIFYVFLFPVAVITRLRVKNMLQLKKSDNSIFKTRNHTYTRADLENTW